MEEVAEGIFKAFLRLASFIVRALVWLIWEMCYEIIAWYVGWPIVRLLTFGQYPREKINEHEAASNLTMFMVGTIGFVFLIVLGTVLAKLMQATGA